jgi:hypothetical protein
LVLNGDNTIEFLHIYNNHIWDKRYYWNWNGVDAGKTMVSNGAYAGKVDQKINSY